MKKQAIYPFVSLSVLLAALNLQAQTLPEAVKLALAYHPQLVISEQSIAAQQAHVVEAEAALKPHVMLSGELGRSTLETPPSFLNRCLLYTSPSPRDLSTSRMPSSA